MEWKCGFISGNCSVLPCSVQYWISLHAYLTGNVSPAVTVIICCIASLVTYHSTPIVHVVCVPVCVSTEVHTCCHPRERPALLHAQATVSAQLLVVHL